MPLRQAATQKVSKFRLKLASTAPVLLPPELSHLYLHPGSGERFYAAKLHLATKRGKTNGLGQRRFNRRSENQLAANKEVQAFFRRNCTEKVDVWYRNTPKCLDFQ